jgi:hypothetical protein
LYLYSERFGREIRKTVSPNLRRGRRHVIKIFAFNNIKYYKNEDQAITVAIW